MNGKHYSGLEDFGTPRLENHMNIDMKGSHENWDYQSGSQEIDFGTPPETRSLRHFWVRTGEGLQIQTP